MKTIVAVTFALVATLHASAQTRLADATNAAAPVITSKLLRYEEGQRGPHQKVWHKVTETARPDGSLLLETNVAYVELATGLHYEQDGRWLEAEELIEAYPGGAVARQGQHKVIWAGDLATAGAVDMELPSGRRLRSHLLGISYFDKASGKAVLVAQVTNCVGRIEGGNRVVYPVALDTVDATVVYTYTRSSLEQDLVINGPLPNPTDFSLSPEDTVVEVITEFVDFPRPVARGLATGDQELDFGSMKMVAGKAFRFGEGGKGVPVKKQWLELEQRQLLIEQVPYLEMEKMLSELPKAEGAAVGKTSRRTLVASIGRLLPPRPQSAGSTNSMEVAEISRRPPGVVIDYLTVAASVTNYVFNSDTTYYISGPVNLDGTTVIEGGVVIKYAPTNTAKLSLSGPLACQTGLYRPGVLTSKNDNSVGETISGSTGNPSNANGGTYIEGTAWQALTNAHLRFSFAGIGVANNASLQLSHCQFVICQVAASHTDDGADVRMENVLSSRCGTLVAGWANLAASHLTADQTGRWFDQDYLPLSGRFTNCLITATTNATVNRSLTFQNTVQSSSNAGFYQAVGGSQYYLVSASTNRNAGSTNLSPNLLGDLRTRTTCAPTAYTNVTFSNAVTLYPQAQRDTDAPDLGYHYDPLDYTFGGCHAYSNLTVTAGTALGWFRTSSGWYHAGFGIHMGDRQIASFEGTASAPCYWVRLTTVQERDTTAGYGPGGLTGWASQYGYDITLSPEVRASYLVGSMSASEGSHFRDDWGYLIVRASHSQFYNGAIGAYVSSFYLTNCLFHRMWLGQIEGWPGNEVVMKNCTKIGHWVDFSAHTYPTYFIVKDNAFDGVQFNLTGYGANASYATYDYNAYTNATKPFPVGGANDKTNVVFNWQRGPLGDWYLPTNSVLIDAGSQSAAAAGLYHHTTTTNQVKDSSTVDIGVHYVAVDGTGLPVDTDGDGLPDYWEDVNGNGTADSGEASWLTSPNGTTGQSGLRVYTPLK